MGKNESRLVLHLLLGPEKLVDHPLGIDPGKVAKRLKRFRGRIHQNGAGQHGIEQLIPGLGKFPAAPVVGSDRANPGLAIGLETLGKDLADHLRRHGRGLAVVLHGFLGGLQLRVVVGVKIEIVARLGTQVVHRLIRRQLDSVEFWRIGRKLAGGGESRILAHQVIGRDELFQLIGRRLHQHDQLDGQLLVRGVVNLRGDDLPAFDLGDQGRRHFEMFHRLDEVRLVGARWRIGCLCPCPHPARNPHS